MPFVGTKQGCEAMTADCAMTGTINSTINVAVIFVQKVSLFSRDVQKTTLWGVYICKMAQKSTGRVERRSISMRWVSRPEGGTLVKRTKEKYGILDKDTHNFDKSGFIMGHDMRLDGLYRV
jgi:hypothetical protein